MPGVEEVAHLSASYDSRAVFILALSIAITPGRVVEETNQRMRLLVASAEQDDLNGTYSPRSNIYTHPQAYPWHLILQLRVTIAGVRDPKDGVLSPLFYQTRLPLELSSHPHQKT